jgi:diphosphomevalonate decarboxylase
MSESRLAEKSSYRASPNLALVKYWGKADIKANLPATSSLGITLAGVETVSKAVLTNEKNEVTIEGLPQDIRRFDRFFAGLRYLGELHNDTHFKVESRNSFPTAAGLASSSSGFAALTCACADAAAMDLTQAQLSAAARLGSASAARSLFGGFVILRAGGYQAEQLFSEDHWPDLRILMAIVRRVPKKISSRDAMELSRTSSPYYSSWLESSQTLFSEGINAVSHRDIEKLGAVMRASYLGMFSTMFTSVPPVMYWLPDSVEIIRACEELRESGIPAWETMDAGPQVKIACLASDVEVITDRIKGLNPDWQILTTKPGTAPAKL